MYTYVFYVKYVITYCTLVGHIWLLICMYLKLSIIIRLLLFNSNSFKTLK